MKPFVDLYKQCVADGTLAKDPDFIPIAKAIYDFLNVPEAACFVRVNGRLCATAATARGLEKLLADYGCGRIKIRIEDGRIVPYLEGRENDNG